VLAYARLGFRVPCHVLLAKSNTGAGTERYVALCANQEHATQLTIHGVSLPDRRRGTRLLVNELAEIFEWVSRADLYSVSACDAVGRLPSMRVPRQASN
jgi:hypothetical protein